MSASTQQSARKHATTMNDRLVQRALLLTSQVLGRVIDEGDDLSPGAVHGVRLAIKRLRAGWYLLRGSVPLAAAQAETRLRTLHHELAAERARHVQQVIVERLRAEEASPAVQMALGELVAELPVESVPTFVRGFAEQIGRTFRAESRAWRELAPECAGADLLPAVQRSYKRLRKAARVASKHNASSYHRWRLCLKRLLHQLELLTGADDGLPEGLMSAWSAQADQLGRLQDLADLRSRIAALHGTALAAPNSAFAELDARLAERQRQLRRKLKAQRDAAFALRPRELAQRIAALEPDLTTAAAKACA